MNYYWTYYAITLFAAYAAKNPGVALLVLAFFAVRPWLPDPVILVRVLSRVGRLKAQAQMNAANVTARRDLGRAYLDLRWYRTALRWLDEARAKDPRDGEIAFLRGLALSKIGAHEAALEALGEAVGAHRHDEEEPSAPAEPARKGAHAAFSRYAEAYLAAASALEKLGRLPQAEDALAMAASHNSSLIEPLVRLARVRRAQGNADGARQAMASARKTFSELPGFMRRRQLGWGVRSYLG
jgi:tetratricopeptide (TPR) repeat protein